MIKSHQNEKTILSPQNKGWNRHTKELVITVMRMIHQAPFTETGSMYVIKGQLQ